eukprot:4106675-Pleurochrysis_carterae.AAC.1
MSRARLSRGAQLELLPPAHLHQQDVTVRRVVNVHRVVATARADGRVVKRTSVSVNACKRAGTNAYACVPVCACERT